MNLLFDHKLLHGVSDEELIAFKASGQFDEKWYVEEYPDVARTGMDPAGHFLWIGRRLGRKGLPPAEARRATRKPNTSPGGAKFNLDALFIDGTNGTSSTPYRVFRIANGLAEEGWAVRCAKGEDLLTLMQEDIRPKFAVFHRAPYWTPFTDYVDQLRGIGATIVYDIDDLVFDEGMIPYIDGYRMLPSEAKQGFLNGVRAYRNFILNADVCTSPTGFLVDEIRKLGKTVYRVRNAISIENIRTFESVHYERKGRPTPFVVGYYSGTKTHQADFAVAAPALIQFMHENPDVVFRLVGEFDIGDWPELAHWQHVHRPGDMPRVTRVGLMPHDVMIRDQFSCDMMLAPLEVGNPFCEAKSELKFFEASLAKVPVIASATRTFAEAAEYGELADLAVTTDDWLAAMRSIYGNYTAALERSQRAYDRVRYIYSQRYAATEALEAYEDFIGAGASSASHELVEAGTCAEIGVILPDMTGPSGGHRKILTICRALIEAGLRVKLNFYSTRSVNMIRRDISRFFGPIDVQIACYNGVIDNHDVVICTQWKTAYDFRVVQYSGRVIYFVQDFEPMFFPAGSDHIRALVSYRIDCQLICYGEWVAAKLSGDVGVNALTIPFTMDHKTYHPPARERARDIDILVFARAGQDRRCLDLIVEGLRAIKIKRPDTKIVLFGENEYSRYDFEFESAGSFSDLEALAALYRRAKVGICFSPTNPSQLGYEMVASGICLVDVRVKYYELNFGGEEFVQYCDGSPEDIAEACRVLLADAKERKRRQGAGYAYVRSMPDDKELGERFMNAANLGVYPLCIGSR